MAGGNKDQGKRKLKGDASSCESNKGSNSGVRELKEMEIYIASKETPHIPEKGFTVVFNESGGEITGWTLQEEGSNLSCHHDNNTSMPEKIPIVKEMVSYTPSKETQKESGGDCTKEGSKSATTDR